MRHARKIIRSHENRGAGIERSWRGCEEEEVRRPLQARQKAKGLGDIITHFLNIFIIT